MIFFSKGNCAVIKPSEVSSAAAELVEKLIPKYLDQVISLCFTMKSRTKPAPSCH